MTRGTREFDPSVRNEPNGATIEEAIQTPMPPSTRETPVVR